MDDQLALRIQLFREGGQVRPEVADFVTAELDALAAEGRPVTEDTRRDAHQPSDDGADPAARRRAHRAVPHRRAGGRGAGGPPRGAWPAPAPSPSAPSAELGADAARLRGQLPAMHLRPRAVLPRGTGTSPPDSHPARPSHRPRRERTPAMTKILTGGVGKTEVADAVTGLGLDGVEVAVSNDMDAAMKLRAGQADYYLGTCHTGAGASLGVLVGLMGQPPATPSAGRVPTEERDRRAARRGQEGLRLRHGPDRRRRPAASPAPSPRVGADPWPDLPGHEGVTREHRARSGRRGSTSRWPSS